MRVTKVRLVNFHNFVDETVDIEGGGHLFLLGDNGSGKTTVLDAVHYALGGGQLEFNAAARIGGNRNEGRTIQGIVLRHDFERGVQNERGAIAYAAVELYDEAADRRLTVGVGTEATTMDARVTKWGFVVRKPVSEVPLVLERDGQRFAATREGLREHLGPSEVFFRIGDYRAAVAGRLFGGPAAYDEVCRFWSMAKAYREIVSGARNFGALFRRLLPAPDPTLFGEIARSLQSLADMDVALADLQDQRRYVAGLIDLSEEIDRQREVASRCRWLVCFRERADARDALAASRSRSAELTAEKERLGREIEAADALLATADAAVHAAEAEDPEGVAEKLREARRREALAKGQCAEREREASEQRELFGRSEREHAQAGADLSSLRRRAGDRLESARAEASRVPGDLPRTRALLAAMSTGGPSQWREPVTSAASEADALADAARRAVDDQRERLARARDRRDRVAAELAALRRRTEERPRVANFEVAVRALEAEGIAAAAIYELLDPVSGAPDDALAAIEALAGDAQLAALVVAERDRERAARLVTERAPGARVVIQTSITALPDWASGLFEKPGDNSQVSAALAALATAVVQPEDLGPIAGPGGDRLVHRGAAFSPETARPRLLGRAARRRAHQKRIADTERALAEAVAAVEAAAETVEIARARLGEIEQLAAAIGGAAAEAIVRAESVLSETERRLDRERELCDAARQRADAAGALADTAGAEVGALAARAESLNLDELTRRIERLADAARTARDRSRDLQSRRGMCAGDLGREQRLRSELETRLAGMDDWMRERCDDVRRRAGLGDVDDSAIERYVRVEQRGDTFKSIETIEARLAEAERKARDGAAELLRDGSRGVRNIHFAARFGFVYDEPANRITDRRDRSAAGLLVELDRTLAEQRSVITNETRELMETLVVSGLARDLQAQVDTLDRLVKDVNRLLGDIRFGRSGYQFKVVPTPERRELVDIVRQVSVLDPDSRAGFRAWIEDRLDELRGGADGEIPEILDYRNWFDYSLRMTTSDDDGVDLTRSVRALGSGGEQGVPNYLLVLALGKLMFETSGAKLCPLLFDEAFYGIDAGRRDQLLRFATQLDLQMFVASPDQDGVTPSARQATTLFIVKDPHGDVHLAPYHYWHHELAAQPDLFAPPAPTEPDAEDAECRLE